MFIFILLFSFFVRKNDQIRKFWERPEQVTEFVNGNDNTRI